MTTTPSSEGVVDRLPTDIWAEIALQMLDARDLAVVFAVALPPPLPPNAVFVAKRVLTAAELDWFAAHAIPVALLQYELVTPNGFKLWYQNGELHRDNDLPAVERGHDYREWWVHGKQHRDNLPAVVIKGLRWQWWVHGKLPACVFAGGCRREWYQHGKLHREKGLPAVLGRRYSDREWWVNGERHRDNDLPAVEHTEGSCEWYVHGKLHRDHDRPAIVGTGTNGARAWYHHGKLHRENDQPAAIWWCDEDNVRQEWWTNNLRHREGGRPAITESATGLKEWFVHGERQEPPEEEGED